MFKDSHGLELTCASQKAATAFDDVVDAYLLNRFAVSQRLKSCLAEDPQFCLAHVLRGAFSMLSFNEKNVAFARSSLLEAQRLAVHVTDREKAHVAALGHWIDGDLDHLMAIWDGIVRQWPLDILAFRLHHFLGFWLGRPEAMFDLVERTLPNWSRSLPAYGTLLACRAFAHEECGSYTIAENAGREAVAIDPTDIWATHAVAHVLETQGRRSEGIRFLQGLEAHWEGGNNLLHHLWWHRALYHLEQREFPEVLALYDGRFRNLTSVLTSAMPDLYIDAQNAVSMLWRLERAGVETGDRWAELADKAEQRIGDCRNPFTLPHWMLALARTGRLSSCDNFISGLRNFVARETSSLVPVVRDAALPICLAIAENARGHAGVALEHMRPALACMHRLGGSHAQQDLLEQLYLTFAEADHSDADIRLIVERVRGRRVLSPADSIGWRNAVARLNR